MMCVGWVAGAFFLGVFLDPQDWGNMAAFLHTPFALAFLSFFVDFGLYIYLCIRLRDGKWLTSMRKLGGFYDCFGLG